MTMTIWVESSHSDSQELNLIKDTPWLCTLDTIWV